MTEDKARSVCKTLLIGALGGAVFQLLGLPLAWMIGPLAANLLASFAGCRVEMPGRLREIALGIMGLMLGSQVTPELATRVVDWPLSLVLLLVGVAVSTGIVTLWYRRCGFDSTSAVFSALPGAMGATVLLADKLGADSRRVAISQSLRIVLVLLLLPPLFVLYEGGEVVASGKVAEAAWQDAWLLPALFIIVPLGRFLKLPVPSLLAPLIIGSALSIAGIASLQVPDWGMSLVLLVLGSFIGTRFSGISFKYLIKFSFHSIVATVLAVLVLAVFAEIIHQLVGVPRDVAMLAMAPGGMTEMAALAVALDIDPLFVTFHHLVRLVVLMLVAPFIDKWIRSQAPRHE